MVKILCDSCGKLKPPSDTRIGDYPWLLGYDIEIERANALQRSLRFLPRWDNARILELGSIHLCSDACKEKYIRKASAVA
ncbi:MAG TPA: hypothetical protein VN176_12075 [Verrucomicrobiae bacterium]|jgi:hypothetical protein|nr:hypothetical protein [Verrucomicrobiae bacterium]